MEHGKPLVPHQLTVIKNEFPESFGMPGKRVFARYDHVTDTYWVDEYIFEAICIHAPGGPRKVTDMIEDIDKIGTVYLPASGGNDEAHCYSITDLLAEPKLDQNIAFGLLDMLRALRAAKSEKGDTHEKRTSH